MLNMMILDFSAFGRRSMRLVSAVLVLGAALLAGCATPLVSEVTAFNTWPADARGATFAFARTAAQRDSLEHGAYEQQVAAELLRNGLVRTTDHASARFVVSMDYNNQGRVERVVEPVFVDPPMIRPSYFDPRFGWVSPGFSPFWGPRFVGTREFNRNVFARRVRVDISEARPTGLARVYEATAFSEGSTRELSTVMPGLIRSLFNEFPQANGSTRRVQVDVATGQVTSAVRATGP
jgi:hypothetical protein